LGEEQPFVHYAEPGAFLFGSWKNVVVAVWEAQGTMTAVEHLGKVGDIVSRAHPEGRSNIHFIATGAGLPEADVRAKFVELMKDKADQLACVAVIYGGTGFWASAFRSFVTGLKWVAPKSIGFHLLGTIEEAVNLVPPVHLKRTGVELDPKELRKVLEGWTAKLSRPPAP
jgi:hypothetical protein